MSDEGNDDQSQLDDLLGKFIQQGKPEPADSYKDATTAHYQLFSAYVDAGFTRSESLSLVMRILQTLGGKSH